MFSFTNAENQVTSMDCSTNGQTVQPVQQYMNQSVQPTIGTQGSFSTPQSIPSVFQATMSMPTLEQPPTVFQHPFKKTKQTKDSGTNIVNKIDYNKIGTEFVKFYYTNINTVQPIVPYLRQSSVFKFSNEEHSYSKLPALFEQLKKYTFNVKKIEVLPSGSRRLDIMVFGNITGSGNFSQYFLLCNEKEQQWYIKSSILV
jgi:hypothetical protein